LGFGFWGLGFWVLAQPPNPQSPIPNPQSPVIVLIKHISIKLVYIIKFLDEQI